MIYHWVENAVLSVLGIGFIIYAAIGMVQLCADRWYAFKLRTAKRQKDLCAVNTTTVQEYWGDPAGNIRRMAGEQEVIAVATKECSVEEWRALCNLRATERSNLNATEKKG